MNFRSETLSVSDVLRVAPGLRNVRRVVLRPHPALRSRVDSLVSPQFWSPPAEKTFQLPHQSVDQTERIISIMTLSNLLLLKVNTSWFVSSSVKVNWSFYFLFCQIFLSFNPRCSRDSVNSLNSNKARVSVTRAERWCDFSAGSDSPSLETCLNLDV